MPKDIAKPNNNIDVAIAIIEKELKILDDDIKELRKEQQKLEQALQTEKDTAIKKEILDQLKITTKAIQDKEVIAIQKIRQLQDMKISKAG